MYKKAHDFNDSGGFQAFWSDIYSLAQRFRSNFGTLPMQASVDPNAEQKILLNGNYDPFNNHDDCLKLMVRGFIKTFGLRARDEVRRIVTFFTFICLIETYLFLLFLNS